MRIDLRFLK